MWFSLARIRTLNYNRYKGIGTTISDSEGNKDRFEFYGLAKDHLMGLKNASTPAVVNKSMSVIRSYTELAHAVMTTILDRLDRPLDLPSGTLANMHRIMEPADCQTRVLKYLPQPVDDRRNSVLSHTDFGSITILSSKIGGLQVVPPENPTAWEYIRPVPGFSIINLGDAMVKLTRGLLRSCTHRVVSPPGAQTEYTRYSLAYLARPEDTVWMKGIDGSSVIPKLAEGEIEEDVTVKEWQMRRNASLRVENFKKGGWQQTRGTEEQSMKHGSTQIEKVSSAVVSA